MHFINTITATLSLANIASCLQSEIVQGRDLAPALVGRQTSDPNKPVTIQIVDVGDNNGSLKYFPEKITAEIGSIVQFHFWPKNHTITESSFAAPCAPIAANLTTAQRPGQKSGFVPVTADALNRPIYNMIINDTKPMWIFCGQKPHCSKGMVMVINENPSSGNTLEKYKAAAAALPQPSSSAPPAGVSASTVTTSSISTSSPSFGNTAGPTLAGTVTSAIAQTATSSGPIAAFTGAGSKAVPGVGLLAAGALWAVL